MFKNFRFNEFDQAHIQKIALEALQKQDKLLSREEKRVQLIEERAASIDYGSFIFEEYDTSKWEEKVQLDSNIYNTFLSNIEEAEVEKIQYILAELLGSVNSVYEHVNICPVNYTSKLKLNLSELELQNESKSIVNDFFNKKYYSLSNYEKDKTYRERTENLSKEIILNEDIEIKEAVEHAYKSIIVENLLEDINFPRTVYYRIKELMESPKYGEVFEQDALVEKWDKFKEKSAILSRVFAALI